MRHESLAKKLDDVDNLTEEFIDSAANKYLEDVKAGPWKEDMEFGEPTVYRLKDFVACLHPIVGKVLGENQ